jgi:4-amino-4-deoxy-L-arabinose transferase-like glycosyltransferase
MRNPNTHDTSSRIILIIFVLALVVRLAYLGGISDMPTFDTPIVDSQEYDMLARGLADEGIMDHTFFWQGFFYPLFLSFVYFLSNGSLITARVVQILLGSAACVFVYRLGADIFDRRTGTLAGVICALYGPLVYFESELLATGWASLWSVILILLLLRAGKKGGMPTYLAIGLCGGLSVITRATFLPFLTGAALYMVYLLRRSSMSWKGIAAREAFIIAGFLMITVPVASLCLRETGQFSFLPRSGSINLYIGNNPDPEETIMTRPGQDWRELTRAPIVEGSESGRENEDYYMNLFTEYVATQPGHFFKGLAGKTVQFVSPRELPRNQDMYVSRNYSRLLSLLVWKAGRFGFPFGILLPFSLLGILIGRRRIPWPMTLFLILYPLSIIMVFVSARYRTPLIPVMAIPASFGFFRIADMARVKKWRSFTITCTVIAAIVLITSIAGPFPVEGYDYEAEMHTMLGISYAKRGYRNKAVSHLTTAQRLDPGSVTAHRMLGLILYEQRRIDEAVEQFEKAYELDPDSYFILYYLGTGLLAQGRTDEGIERLEQALSKAIAAKEDALTVQIRRILDAEARKRQSQGEQ